MFASHFKKLTAVSALCLVGASAMAAEAGRVVFAVGDARIEQRAAEIGHTVQEGDKLTTGTGGYIYLKTVDNGFFILRPGSSARIVNYHIDPAQADNTRIKIELQNGVARHISGEAVKSARQNFRFNTPVSAIGVRGTDFTVFTNQEVSRIAVTSGGVVVSGFTAGCRPEGAGPCEGGLSRELFASQAGQVLQVGREQGAPQILRGASASPDQSAPPRNDEPVAKHGNMTDPTLAPLKNASLNELVASPVAPVAPEAPQVLWGRWQAVLNQPASIDLAKLGNEGAKVIAINDQFALLRTKDSEWQSPTSGSMAFALKRSEAYVLDEKRSVLTPATLENGRLQVNFANTSFATSFDLVSQAERFKFQAQGTVSRDGLLNGASQFERPTNMAVTGVLSKENGGSAAYLFQGRIDDQRVASGATYWGR